VGNFKVLFFSLKIIKKNEFSLYITLFAVIKYSFATPFALACNYFWILRKSIMGVFSLFSQSLIKENYVFFDVETTGLYPLDGDRVIELAMIKTARGNIVETFDTMLNPQRPIPIEASRINNINDDMVKEAPAFDADMADKILKFINGSILVAHNAPFDISFLSLELAKLGICFDGWKAIDTMKIASLLFPDKRIRLENLISHYKLLPEGDLHRALADTDALRRVFFEFLEETEIRSYTVDILIKKFGYTGQNIHRAVPANIRESLAEKKIIRGLYQKRDGNKIKLSVVPLSPIWSKEGWFLLAKITDTGEEKVLNCDSFLEYYD
jgi:DNA polymerase III epsilon subunit